MGPSFLDRGKHETSRVHFCSKFVFCRPRIGGTAPSRFRGRYPPDIRLRGVLGSRDGGADSCRVFINYARRRGHRGRSLRLRQFNPAVGQREKATTSYVYGWLFRQFECLNRQNRCRCSSWLYRRHPKSCRAKCVVIFRVQRWLGATRGDECRGEVLRSLPQQRILQKQQSCGPCTS